MKPRVPFGIGSVGRTILPTLICVAGLLSGCSSANSSDGSGGLGTSSGTQGGSGNGGAGETGCDPTTSSKPIASTCGVFVSSTKGSDRNEGSQAKPVQSFAKAIELAKGNTIYACGEKFEEALDITAGVTIYGALDCENGWSYGASKPTVVAPTAREAALTIAGASTEVEINDVSFAAIGGSAPGESSIGAFVHDSTKVSLVRVEIAAGAGSIGDDGKVENVSFPQQADLNGNNASGLGGGATKACACPSSGVQIIGGAGGNAPPSSNGNPGLPDLGGGAAGMLGKPCASGGSGAAGNSAAAAPSASGARTLGELTSAGWRPSIGSDAAAGGPGQGGGGGASNATGGGGGGGCGGCGGAGGKGAQGGGGSIALLVFKATLSLDEGKLTANDAGDGGKGVTGQPAQTIFGFNGNGTNGACPGGIGGTGGDGGASGGGAGGVSAAILFKGKKPSLTKTTSAHGIAGNKGVGGDPGNNDGVVGEAGDLLEAP